MQSFEQSERTRFAARIIGPLMLAMGAMLLTRGAELQFLLPAFFQEAPLVFVTAIFTLIAGLTLFAAHHHWNSLTAIIVSLLAVAMIFRGLVLLIAPEVGASISAAVVRTTAVVPIAGGLVMLLGLWLSVVGWFFTPRPDLEERHNP